jgi:hypothetical protein
VIRLVDRAAVRNDTVFAILAPVLATWDGSVKPSMIEMIETGRVRLTEAP